MQNPRNVVRLDPPRTYDEWLADVRKASNDDNCYVVGTNTCIFFEDGAVFMMGIIGSIRVGTHKDFMPEERCLDFRDDFDNHRTSKIVGYCDDPSETVRDEFGRAEMTPEAAEEYL